MTEDDIKMKPINGDVEDDQMGTPPLAEEGDVLIWANDGPDEKSVFINVGNATMSMPESVFYTLTKLTQQVAKTLLNLD